MSITENIAKFRKEKGWTQAELGEKLGVSNQSVSKWESGNSLPDVMLLPTIAEVLGVSLYDLYGHTTPKGSGLPLLNDDDKRILVIHVIAEGIDVVTRLPVSAIRSTFSNAITKEILASAGLSDTDGLLGMLDGGMTGTLLDVDNDDCHVTIQVENYEN